MTAFLDAAITVEREGWRLSLTDGGLPAAVREELIGCALAAARGTRGAPRRRSRHARTWQAKLGAPAELEIFIKLLDAPRGRELLKRWVRGPRSAHVARITQALADAGFNVPPVIAIGMEAATGRELIVAPRAEGEGPLRTLAALRSRPLAHKRAVLRALGAEIARLHRCGFVHGDLTPFNIFFVRAEPPRFVLIDHERTRRLVMPGRGRVRLRNLVQLGRFALPGISTTDRMRVFDGYAVRLAKAARRRLARRAHALLGRRIRRDGLAPVHNPFGEAWPRRGAS
ncbi:MAG TPA: lipopolysaccharide kinase InaA family protein [Candidatus Binataceae bacterium]|nr:lipopolysaccharide kinase InaA family protein [Candidatus Binataceae bacterium]